MSTEEQYDGEVHGLLAMAFDDHVPPLDLVSGAVDGYRRHRRRTRVLGTAGGALALTGVVLAGTALVGARGDGPAPGTDAVSPAAGSVTTVNPACIGIYDRFSTQPGAGIYTADSTTLARVCSGDLAALRAAIPGSEVTPVRESLNQAVARHDAAPGAVLPPGATADTPIVQSGAYTVAVGGRTATVEFTVAGKQGWGFTGCTLESCPPNLHLADGTPATESPDAGAESGVAMLSLHVGTARWVLVGAYAQKALPFDFSALVRTQAFAAAVAGDVRELDQPA